MEFDGYSAGIPYFLFRAMPELRSYPYSVDAARHGEGKRHYMSTARHIGEPNGMPVVNKLPTFKRNGECPCGSLKKYKRCCLDKYVIWNGDMNAFQCLAEGNGDMDPDNLLFWCNEDGHGWGGWGCFETATIFSKSETGKYRLPIDPPHKTRWVPLWVAVMMQNHRGKINPSSILAKMDLGGIL